MLFNFSKVMARMDKVMENGQNCSGPEAPATQATSGCPKGYEDPYLGTSVTQSASVLGLGSSN